jgi:hypothetical protein
LPKLIKGLSTTDQLIQTFLVTQIQQLAQQQSSFQHTVLMHPPPPPPLSSIQSNTDLSELLLQFFNWFILRSNIQQKKALKNI